MTAIVYTSSTGTTEKYAKLLSEKTGIACYELSKAKLEEGTEVVYLGWVLMNEIQGLAKAREQFGELKAVGAVGMMNTEKGIGEVKEKMKIEEPFFFLPGTFNVSNLKGMYKIMMGMAVKMMKSKAKESDDPSVQKALEMFENGIDMFSEDNIEPLAQFLSGEKVEE